MKAPTNPFLLIFYLLLIIIIVAVVIFLVVYRYIEKVLLSPYKMVKRLTKQGLLGGNKGKEANLMLQSAQIADLNWITLPISEKKTMRRTAWLVTFTLVFTAIMAGYLYLIQP